MFKVLLVTKNKRLFKREMKHILRKIFRKKRLSQPKFPGTGNYWENRYVSSRNSGPGSYGRLADFKAKIINGFVLEKDITNVIELGCGDGNQLTKANYKNYLGFDISQKALAVCREKFKDDKTKSFMIIEDIDPKTHNAELVLSLDVIFHLIEDNVFNNYMSTLFNVSSKYVVIYSSDYDLVKAAHVKCRKFTDWINSNVADNWKLINFIENEYPFDPEDPDNTSMSDFYIYEKVS